ncbi:MAG TPA: pyrroline-5-carboxylate reductase [Peptococcaceae bacterium]|nr:pyrroline-5-carboxylate reductase [Peptococcaceae bacterium]
MNKIGFIGAGNLADSIIKGLTQRTTDYQIYLCDLLKEKADALARQYNVQSRVFAEVVRDADILLLTVKPKDIKGLLQELAGYSLLGKLVIAVAAGIGLNMYEEALPGIGIVRVMPNTSCAVLHSVSGLVRGKYVTEDQAAAAERIFSAVGKVLWVEDSKINAVTAVSGSGPAYFYLLTELMAEAGAKLGLSREEANFLARETLVGAGKMLAEITKTPQELREAVTSPNGTTYAALKIFEQEDLERIVFQAMQACLKRAEEMEREYKDE